jgi:hypothetical protein
VLSTCSSQVVSPAEMDCVRQDGRGRRPYDAGKALVGWRRATLTNSVCSLAARAARRLDNGS